MGTKSELSKDLLKIESRLQQVLKPVRLRTDFVEELRIQLNQEMIKKAKAKKVKTGLLLAGGVVGMVVMVITLVRSLINLPNKLKSKTKNLPRLRKRQQAASI